MIGLPPWHMWGSTQQLRIDGNVGLPFVPADAPSLQIANVAYGRPDTWEFIISAQLTSVVAPANVSPIRVVFDLIVGLGRTTVNILQFATFEWSVAQQTSLLGITRMTSQVELPGENSTRVSPNLCDHLAAQTIVCNARSFQEGGNPGTIFLVQCGAFFAPRTHIRPEWHQERFPGDETEGH